MNEQKIVNKRFVIKGRKFYTYKIYHARAEHCELGKKFVMQEQHIVNMGEKCHARAENCY